jgi:hypothetical protein
MKTIMTLNELTTVEQLKHFLDGTQICVYTTLCSKSERYRWTQRTLVQFSYMNLKKVDKGVVILYLIKVGGYSRQQTTRLIKQYTDTGKVVRSPHSARGFSRRYTDADIRLLAKLDGLHQSPCGTVIKKLCERSYEQHNESGFERLSSISVSHIYNLRVSKTYQRCRRNFEKTKSKRSTIGERRKPQPNGLPGYFRIDTVHQGDQDKVKGVYHINLVDEVTQFEITCCVEKISELYLVPALELMFDKIPYKIRGFHSDNGSEYINKMVAALLEKMCIEFTKSRSRKSNDNALAEGKNAAIVRKTFGYSHIPQKWAKEINDVIQESMFRYINFHRPCFFPTIEIDKKGKEKKKYLYKNMMTPYEKLISLPNIKEHLKVGITLEKLEEFAKEMTDNEAAKIFQDAKKKIFSSIFTAQEKG